MDWELNFYGGRVRLARTGFHGGYPGVELPSDMVDGLSEDILLRYAALTLLPVPKKGSLLPTEIEGAGEVRNPTGTAEHCVYLDKETARTIRDELRRRTRYGRP